MSQKSSNIRLMNKCANLCTFGYIRYYNRVNVNKWNLPIPVDVEFLCYQFLGHLPMTYNYVRMSKYLSKQSISIQPMDLYLALNGYSQNTIESNVANNKLSAILKNKLDGSNQQNFDKILYKYLTHGSIQKLINNNTKWKTVGIGKLESIQNKYNPTKLLLKLVCKKKKKIYIFQCKPKNKMNRKAIILKGTESTTNREFVLAVRFNAENSKKRLKDELDRLYKMNKSPQKIRKVKRRCIGSRRNSDWDCQLCLHHNGYRYFECIVCNSPTPLQKPKDTQIIEKKKDENKVSPNTED